MLTKSEEMRDREETGGERERESRRKKGYRDVVDENANWRNMGKKKDRARDSKRERERATETGQNCIDNQTKDRWESLSVILVDLLKKIKRIK